MLPPGLNYTRWAIPFPIIPFSYFHSFGLGKGRSWSDEALVWQCHWWKRELWRRVSADALAGMTLEIYHPPWYSTQRPRCTSYSHWPWQPAYSWIKPRLLMCPERGLHRTMLSSPLEFFCRKRFCKFSITQFICMFTHKSASPCRKHEPLA